MKPILNSDLLQKIQGDDMKSFPEKILQFGTGILLRGLAGDIIQRANDQEGYNGKIVVVKSTSNDVREFAEQDNLYTIQVKGIENGKTVDEQSINQSISRVIAANSHWHEVLEVAGAGNLKVIISNTTEAGLIYRDEVLKEGECPESFPAKVFACLYHRYKKYAGDTSKGIVILPLELVHENGAKLKEFVLKHAENNNVEKGFMKWLHEANFFCNTIVDRIVPGKTEKEDLLKTASLEYIDHLHVTAEPYYLLAIEGAKDISEKIEFGKSSPGFVIAESIEDRKEQKLRILNGSNSLVASPALQAGLVTTYDTMYDPEIEQYTTRLIYDEILPTIQDKCPEAEDFAGQVLDRFRNPFIRYPLKNICFQATSKMNSRVMETINRQYDLKQEIGPLTLTGLASYFIYYTPAGKKESGEFYGSLHGEEYSYRDDQAHAVLEEMYRLRENGGNDPGGAIAKILSNRNLFQVNPDALPLLIDGTTAMILNIRKDGIRNTIKKALEK
jgi:tagaturonate reductase